MFRHKKVITILSTMILCTNIMQSSWNLNSQTTPIDINNDGSINILDIITLKDTIINTTRYTTDTNVELYQLSESLNFRVGAGTVYTSYGMIPKDTIIQVTETQLINGILWGKHEYNGQVGWTSLKYAQKLENYSPTNDINSLIDTKKYVIGFSEPNTDTPILDDSPYYINSDGNFIDENGNLLYVSNSPLLQTDIFGEYYEQARKYIQNMTLEEKVGQLFLVGCSSSDSDIINSIEKYHLGGIVLFAYNFEGKSVSQVQSSINSYQNSIDTPLIVAVDEEGGSINRISKYSQFRSTPFSSPQKLYKSGGLDAIYNETVEKATLLKSLGINLNLAPVADVSTNPSDYIYYRTFGKNGTETAEYISTSVDAYNSQNLACTLKHFPGYGSNVNTHTGISIDNRSKETFYTNDFLPFMKGIENNAPIVMVNHNIVKCFDETMPSSLSTEVHRILRQDLHHTGLIVTDDLYMDAIKNYTGTTNACVYAIQSGNDLLATSNFISGYNAILNAIDNGTLSEYRIDESAIRVIAYKYAYGLM